MVKAIVVDDEILAIKRLKRLIGETGKVEVVNSFIHPEEAINFIRDNSIDLAFLDIEMPTVNGIELSEQILNIQSDVKIIFVTAFNQYAVEAFEVNALDYLLKPVSADRLNKTLDRIFDSMDTTKNNTNNKNILGNNENDMKANGNNIEGSKNMPDFHVNCFKKFEIVLNDEKLIKWRTNKAKELITYFIHHGGELISKEQIMDDLWGDFDIEKAATNLYTTMYYVRKMFKNLGLDDLIISSMGNCKIDKSKYKCDAYEFEDFIDKYDRIEKYTNENINKAYEVLKLYKGEYLLDCDYIWAYDKRLEFENKFVEISAKDANFYMDKGNYNLAIEIIRNVIDVAPLREEGHIKLIKIYGVMGKKNEAIKQYQISKKLLKEELDIDLNEKLIKFL